MNPPTNSPRIPDEEKAAAAPLTPEQAQSDALLPAFSGRRSVLRGAAAGFSLVVGAGIVAACSSPPVQPPEPAPSSPGEAKTTEGAAPEATKDAPSAGAAAGGTATSKVPVGGGTIFADTKTVVTQPEAGTFKAFDTTCPHAFCAVAKVAEGKIDCPCHGSQFDITTGDRVAGPAEKGLTAKKITVTGDTFTVA